MMHQMMKQCCGADGRPDLDKMTKFMQHHDLAAKLDGVGWALFFVWVGIAWLAELGLGIGLLGVAVIVLGGQIARKLLDLRVEGFWVVVGLGFGVGGLWELLDVQTPLMPIVLIAAGAALLIWMLWPKALGPRDQHD